ncbi:MAG TPA: hypothetical protein VHV75_14595 [Solirubrobacteraceae bacterium]|nr:hypothetical protein [Solirubrobacteraceae bacterium]
MHDEVDADRDGDDGEELLKRALLDAASAVSVSLRIEGLPVSEAVTVIFYARRDLGTLQTYLTPGSRGAGARVSPSELLRVPCDLDLADATDRDEAERLYAEQARTLRDALLGADVVLGLWREALVGLLGRVVTQSAVELPARAPLPRLLPTALVAPESQVVVTPVCTARTLAGGQPPVGIACIQQEVAHVYQLTEDPEGCVIDFMDRSARHAHDLAEQIAHQEASVERFLELSDAA